MQTTFPKPKTRPTSIHPDTKMGYVQLMVPDFKTSLPFYQDVMGFKVHKNEKGTARLGAGSPGDTGGEDLLVLIENPDARNPGRATGLYHFAILVPSRLELARSLRNFAQHEIQLGFGDHIVSE